MVRHLMATSEGQIRLINLFHSVHKGLVGRKVARKFLADCLAATTRSSAAAVSAFDQTRSTSSAYHLLKQCDIGSVDKAVPLCTSFNANTFHQYILARPRKSKILKRVVPMQPRSPGDPAEEDRYRRSLAHATSTTNWHAPLAMLGKPYPDPKFVWMTKSAELDHAVSIDPEKHSLGTKIRDALGLIDTQADAFLLSITFPAGTLSTVASLVLARPTFSDLGNSRYAAHLPKGESTYSDGWGLTVNLGKLARKEKDVRGVCERLSSPIPLSALAGNCTVEPRGWVEVTRGTQLHIDDDPTFAKKLLGRRRISSITRNVISLADCP